MTAPTGDQAAEPVDLDAAEAAAKAAPAGPWTVRRTTPRTWAVEQGASKLTAIRLAGGLTEPLAVFIAAARAAMPAMVREIWALRAEVEHLHSREAVTEAFLAETQAVPSDTLLPVQDGWRSAGVALAARLAELDKETS